MFRSQRLSDSSSGMQEVSQTGMTLLNNLKEHKCEQHGTNGGANGFLKIWFKSVKGTHLIKGMILQSFNLLLSPLLRGIQKIQSKMILPPSSCGACSSSSCWAFWLRADGERVMKTEEGRGEERRGGLREPQLCGIFTSADNL